ncbi:hypothetical protein SALWKB2_1927 [Snodgrassella alvi wkB2]|nr:hypothetical protein SALWKB2_1927 [Snodgrassella alvi wkB2]
MLLYGSILVMHVFIKIKSISNTQKNKYLLNNVINRID